MPYRVVLLLLVSCWCVSCSPEKKAGDDVTASAQPPEVSGERTHDTAVKDVASKPGGARGVSFAPKPKATLLAAHLADVLPVRAKGPVAMVDGVPIRAIAFNREIARLRDNSGLTARSSLRPQARNVIDQLIDDHIFDRAIETARIRPTESQIDAALEASRARFGTPAQYKNFLELQDLDGPGHRAVVARDVAVRMLLKEEGLSIVTEADLRDAYNANLAKHKISEQVSARHILFRTNKTMEEHELRAARKKADEVYQLASRDGADFAALASEYSEGPTAKRGGQLGYFPRGRMVKPFEDVAFELGVGEVSAPVKTRFGWHLVKVEGHEKARVKSFEEVRDAIEADLAPAREREARATFLANERAASEIAILSDNLVFTSGSE